MFPNDDFEEVADSSDVRLYHTRPSLMVGNADEIEGICAQCDSDYELVVVGELIATYVDQVEVNTTWSNEQPIRLEITRCSAV